MCVPQYPSECVYGLRYKAKVALKVCGSAWALGHSPQLRRHWSWPESARSVSPIFLDNVGRRPSSFRTATLNLCARIHSCVPTQVPSRFFGSYKNIACMYVRVCARDGKRPIYTRCVVAHSPFMCTTYTRYSPCKLLLHVCCTRWAASGSL